MTRRAFILGGTGNVGSAIAHALAHDGWDVTIGSRASADGEFATVKLDRDDDSALAVADGFELLVDVIPYEPEHAEQLLRRDVGALVAISSASVYTDDEGRTFGLDDFPHVPVPIPETQRTVEPGDTDYSTKKAQIERRLLENDRTPAAVVRPCAIYGRGDRLAREWHFVKRKLDGRRFVLLSRTGVGPFHTTAAANIGELVRLLAAQPRTDVYNCGDPDPPTVQQIARRIGDFTEILIPDENKLGHTPWSVPKPFVVDMSKAERELGYAPATTWADAIGPQVEWLIEATRGRDWREVLPRGAEYLRFEYEAEDELVRSLAA